MSFSKEKARLIMANKCMSMAEVTRKAGLANTTLYKIMADNSMVQPSIRTIGKIARALGCEVQELLAD